MQPNYAKRPTVDELLDKNIFKIIQSVDKSKIRKVLLTDGKFLSVTVRLNYRMINFVLAKKYRVSTDESAEPLQKWTQLMNYSRERGANDATRLESLYLGMGRNEFFSSVNYKDVRKQIKAVFFNALFISH